MEASHTQSKSLGYPADRYAFGVLNNLLQDHYNQSLERSLLQTDVPHAFVFQYVYDLPFGALQRWANTNRLARVTLDRYLCPVDEQCVAPKSGKAAARDLLPST